MKKKLVPVLVVLALVAVGGFGYFMGQQSIPPAVETLPAESSEVQTDAAPQASPITAAPRSLPPLPSR